MLCFVLFLKEPTTREKSDSWSTLLGLCQGTQFSSNWLNALNPYRSSKFQSCNIGSWTKVALFQSAIRLGLTLVPRQESREEAAVHNGMEEDRERHQRPWKRQRGGFNDKAFSGILATSQAKNEALSPGSAGRASPLPAFLGLTLELPLEGLEQNLQWSLAGSSWTLAYR